MFCHSKNFRKPQIWDKRNSTILWPHRLTGNPTSPTFTFSFKPHLDLTALLKQQGVLAALGKHPRNLPWVIFLFAKSSNSKRLSCSASIQVQNFAVKEKINLVFDHNSGNQLPFFLNLHSQTWTLHVGLISDGGNFAGNLTLALTVHQALLGQLPFQLLLVMI